MCRFVYLGVRFRDRTPAGAAALVRSYARHLGVGITPITPEPNSTLARFADRASVVTVVDCGHCACGWGELEHQGACRVAVELLEARDVSRVHLGSWYISNGTHSADRHSRDRVLSLVETPSTELAAVRWHRAEHQLAIHRTGPPWPTRRLVDLYPSGSE